MEDNHINDEHEQETWFYRPLANRRKQDNVYHKIFTFFVFRLRTWMKRLNNLDPTQE